MKTLTLVVGLAGALAFTTAAFAAGSSDSSQASACGQTIGAFADVNGNFGWLGPLGGTPGYHDAVGQQTHATGSNNSTAGTTVCNPSTSQPN